MFRIKKNNARTAETLCSKCRPHHDRAAKVMCLPHLQSPLLFALSTLMWDKGRFLFSTGEHTFPHTNGSSYIAKTQTRRAIVTYRELMYSDGTVTGQHASTTLQRLALVPLVYDTMAPLHLLVFASFMPKALLQLVRCSS